MKTVEFQDTEALKQGRWVHKLFEERLRDGVALLPELAAHEPQMARIAALPGTMLVERKVALTIKLKPTTFFASDVWWRGIIDVQKKSPDGRMHLISDHKTGKQHNKMRQLKLFALYGFAEGAEMVRSEFYWTQSKTTTKLDMARVSIPDILTELLPDLKQYKEAWKDNIWQPRPNGLCKNYCGVKGCEFNGKAMGRR